MTRGSNAEIHATLEGPGAPLSVKQEDVTVLQHADHLMIYRQRPLLAE